MLLKCEKQGKLTAVTWYSNIACSACPLRQLIRFGLWVPHLILHDLDHAVHLTWLHLINWFSATLTVFQLTDYMIAHI